MCCRLCEGAVRAVCVCGGAPGPLLLRDSLLHRVRHAHTRGHCATGLAEAPAVLPAATRLGLKQATSVTSSGDDGGGGTGNSEQAPHCRPGVALSNRRFVLDETDGRAARTFNQSSTLGAVLDMVTDRQAPSQHVVLVKLCQNHFRSAGQAVRGLQRSLWRLGLFNSKSRQAQVTHAQASDGGAAGGAGDAISALLHGIPGPHVPGHLQPLVGAGFRSSGLMTSDLCRRAPMLHRLAVQQAVCSSA